MPLTNTTIKNAKTKDKPYKLTDGRGMYLLVNQKGKYFRMNYRFQGKQKTLALGVYPDVTLAEARKKRDEAKKLIANGVDPVEHKKETKALWQKDSASSFEMVAREWSPLP